MSTFFLKSFPGNYSYQGDAKIYTSKKGYSIFLDLRLNFTNRTEVKALFTLKSEEDFYRSLHIEDDMFRANNIILRNKLILTGRVISTERKHIEGKEAVSGEFSVIQVVTIESLKVFRTLPDGNVEHETLKSAQEEDTIHIKFYLNKSFTSNDRFYGVDNKLSYPSSRKSEILLNEDCHEKEVYRQLKSGYSVRCGRSYIEHMDESPFTLSNRNLVYKLTFVELLFSLKSEKIFLEKNKDQNIPSLNKKLRKVEILTSQICSFLSLVRSGEPFEKNDCIHPLFFEYAINHEGQFISGLMIPVSNELRMDELDDTGPSVRGLMPCLEAILECCPLSERFTQGLFILGSSLSSNELNFKLISICSAIEYFFSYWIYELGGHDFIQNNEHVSSKLKKNLKREFDAGRTPKLSIFLELFLAHIGVDISKHGISEGEGRSTLFLVFRNDILHGKFISREDVRLVGAVTQASYLVMDIMISLLEVISESDDENLYASLKPKPKISEHYLMSTGWDEIVEAMNEIYSTSPTKKYWTD